MSDWQIYGRQLVLEMSELKDSTNINNSLTPLAQLLSQPTSRRTSSEATESFVTLEGYAEPLLYLDYVICALRRAKRLLDEVGNAAMRLESSFESRRATIRNFVVLRSIEEQAREVRTTKMKIQKQWLRGRDAAHRRESPCSLCP